MGEFELATIKEVAKKAGVSISTVSRVINSSDGAIGISEATRKRVIEAAKELNYVPNTAARNLRRGLHKHQIGFLFYQGKESLSSEPFFLRIFEGVYIESHAANMQLKFVYLDNDKAAKSGNPKKEYATQLANHHLVGLITLGYLPNPIRQAISSIGLPAVSIFSHDAECQLDSIETDDAEAMCQVIDHLQSYGHSNIGFLSGTNIRGFEQPAFAKRRTAFKKIMKKRGLINFDSQITDFVVNWAGITRGENIYDPVEVRRISHFVNKFSAIVAANDYIALWVLSHFYHERSKLCPCFSVVGCDDIEASRYSSPSMTTVRIGKKDIGRDAVKMLKRRLLDRNLPSQRCLKGVELVVRNSTRESAIISTK